MDIKKMWLCTRPVAHRGLHTDDKPENSLAAFVNACEYGFPIETDVQSIDDGTVIVFHDDNISRMTSHDGYVSNLTSDKLNELRLAGTDEKIPTFEQLLETVNGKVPLLIEIKNEGKVGFLEQKVIDMLSSYNGDFAVQSFNPYSMEYFKKNASGIIRGQLSMIMTKNNMSGAFKRFMFNSLKIAKISSPDFISYNAPDLPNKKVAKLNIPTLAWTVRSNTEMEKVSPYCDNIIFENFIPVKTNE